MLAWDRSSSLSADVRVFTLFAGVTDDLVLLGDPVEPIHAETPLNRELADVMLETATHLAPLYAKPFFAVGD